MLQEQDVSGVGVSGSIQGTATSFKVPVKHGITKPSINQYKFIFRYINYYDYYE